MTIKTSRTKMQMMKKEKQLSTNMMSNKQNKCKENLQLTNQLKTQITKCQMKISKISKSKVMQTMHLIKTANKTISIKIFKKQNRLLTKSKFRINRSNKTTINKTNNSNRIHKCKINHCQLIQYNNIKNISRNVKKKKPM